jgi:hypothetical protein
MFKYSRTYLSYLSTYAYKRLKNMYVIVRDIFFANELLMMMMTYLSNTNLKNPGATVVL